MIEVDAAAGVTKVAEPVGVIAGIVPTTNPTSTAIFKALLTLKTRNALVLCPHPRAAKSTIEAVGVQLAEGLIRPAPSNWLRECPPTCALAKLTWPMSQLLGPGCYSANDGWLCWLCLPAGTHRS